MGSKKAVVKAIILSGGSSLRMNLKLPKQLLKIGSKPVLGLALEPFVSCPEISSIVLVANRRFIKQHHSLIKRYNYRKVKRIVTGGSTRQQSVFNALKAIKDCDYVVIHDRARPFVSQKMIRKVLNAAKRYNAATCAVRAVDTTVLEKRGFIDKRLIREKIWRIQTPQAFRFNLIFKAHLRAQKKGKGLASDDTQLLLPLKRRVKLVQSEYRNIKITTKADLSLAKRIGRG